MSLKVGRLFFATMIATNYSAMNHQNGNRMNTIGQTQEPQEKKVRLDMVSRDATIENRTKRVIVSGESAQSMLVVYYLLKNKTFMNSDWKIYLVYEKPSDIKNIDPDNKQKLKLYDYSNVSGSSGLSFVRQWMKDPWHNKGQEIHAYLYHWDRLKKLFTKPSGLKNFQSSVETLACPAELRLEAPASQQGTTLIPRQIFLSSGQSNKESLDKYLSSQSSDKLVIIDGRSYTYHSFGPAIGQLEIYSEQLKGIKGDLYVLNSGIHVLQILSALAIKTPILQLSTDMWGGLKLKDGQDGGEKKKLRALEELNFNGRVQHLTSDYMPVVGVSKIKNNMIMNFGINHFQFQKSPCSDEEPAQDIQLLKFNLSCLYARYVTHLVIQKLKLEKTDEKDGVQPMASLNEKENELIQLANPARFSL